MNLINPNDVTFEQAENGFLRLKMKDGTVYEMVECTPLFPLSQPDAYISICSRNSNGSEEIGIISELKALSKEQ